MEQHALRIVNNCLNTNIYSYLEKSGGQNSNLHLNVVHFFNTSLNKTSVAASDSFLLHSHLICAVLLRKFVNYGCKFFYESNTCGQCIRNDISTNAQTLKHNINNVCNLIKLKQAI